jgi:hypothetical protein
MRAPVHVSENDTMSFSAEPLSTTKRASSGRPAALPRATPPLCGYQKGNIHLNEDDNYQGSFDEMNPDESGLLHLFSYLPRKKSAPEQQPKKKWRKKA